MKEELFLFLRLEEVTSLLYSDFLEEAQGV